MKNSFKFIFFLLTLFVFSGCSNVVSPDEQDNITINNDVTSVDSSTLIVDDDALVIMEAEHYRIHIGEGFEYSNRLTGISAGAVNYFLVNTTTKGVHWRDFQIISDANDQLIEFFESPTITNSGTLQNSVNRNRYSSLNSTAEIYLNPTVTSDGTRLYVTGIEGGGGGGGKGGEATGVPLEWILKHNETYLLKITNNNGNNVVNIFSFFWYEIY